MTVSAKGPSARRRNVDVPDWPDDEALRAIVSIVRAQVRLMLRGKDVGVQDDGDITNEIVYALFRDGGRAYKKFDPKRGTRLTFVRTFAKSRMLEIIRKEQRRLATGAAPIAFGELDDAVTGAPTPEELVLAGAHCRCIMQCLKAHLSERDSKLFALRLQEGLSYQELADALEVSVSTVTNVLHAARTRAKRCIEECEAGS